MSEPTHRGAFLELEAIEACLFHILAETNGGLGDSKSMVAEAVRAADAAESAILRLPSAQAEARAELQASLAILERIRGRLSCLSPVAAK
jgi:hypothetical protein